MLIFLWFGAVNLFYNITELNYKLYQQNNKNEKQITVYNREDNQIFSIFYTGAWGNW